MLSGQKITTNREAFRCHDGGLVVVVLQGMIGSGKSQLAMKYCRDKHAPHAPSEGFEAIYLVDASSKAAFVCDLAGILKARPISPPLITADIELINLVTAVVLDRHG